jgi:hypothetical protein
VTGRAVLRFSPNVAPPHSAADGAEMHRDDLMKKDLVSEVVLLGSVIVIVLCVIITLIAAFTRVSSLP